MEQELKLHQNSQFQEDMVFDEKNWVVTVMNTGPRLSGHAMILVEGIHYDEQKGKSDIFVGQYDMLAQIYSDNLSTSSVSSVSSVPSNLKGKITKVRVFEYNDYKRDYSKFKSSSKSFEASSDDVLRMIDSIKADKEKTDAILSEVGTADLAESNKDKREQKIEIIQDLLDSGKLSDLMDYQMFSRHYLFANGDGHNCSSWCAEKLEVCRINLNGKKPKKLTGQSTCCISYIFIRDS